MAESPAIEIRDLSFGYGSGANILAIPEFSVARGKHVFLHGPSGSGKTTLLGILAGIIAPRSGSVHLLGTALHELSPARRDRFRGAHIGYIFQIFNLIPFLDVRENILLPCRLIEERRARIAGGDLIAAAGQAARALEIESLLDRPVTELSVGQQQRVAAARAVVGGPEIIIADEPTSALDTDLRGRFLELLFHAAEESSMTIVFVSHDHGLADRFDRSVSLGEINRAGGTV